MKTHRIILQPAHIAQAKADIRLLQSASHSPGNVEAAAALQDAIDRIVACNRDDVAKRISISTASSGSGRRCRLHDCASHEARR
jgi:hypothetical protein